MPEKNESKLYELAVLLRPDLEADTKPAVAKIAKIIADAGGTVETDAEFKRQDMAYAIKGEKFALYGYYRLSLPALAPEKMSGILNITDEVLRYLLVKVDEKAEAYFAEEASARKERAEEPAETTEDDK